MADQRDVQYAQASGDKQRLQQQILGLLYEWHGKVDQKDLNMHIMGFLPDGVFDIKVSFVPNDQVSFHQIPKLATASVLHGVPAVSAGPASTTPLKQKTANKSTTAQASRKP